MGQKLLPYLYKEGIFRSTLIVSPPGCGKTTLLRDLIRYISNGNEYAAGQTVGVVDERSEIASCYKGIPGNDVGIRTDIYDCCPKVEGIMLMIRAMSPQVLAVDEIGGKEDLDALARAVHAGIRLVATVHGQGIDDIQGDLRIFKRYIFDLNIYYLHSICLFWFWN